ncbi:MAG: glutathione S-transferase family protein [Pseudomonadota bacterium]
MIKVISFNICPFVQRVTAILEAKEIPYKIDYISLRDKPDWFLEISPTGQVPVLISESGQALFESDAIAEYLDEIYPPLDSDISPEQRAIDRAWSYQGSKHYLVQCSAQRSADKKTLQERAGKLAKAFEKAEKQLGDGPFFKGKSLSNVDLAWLPLLHRADIIKRRSCYDFVGEYPRVKAWQVALLNTGLAARSVPENFEDAFSSFYLSDETFLGSGRDCTNELCDPRESGSRCC